MEVPYEEQTAEELAQEEAAFEATVNGTDLVPVVTEPEAVIEEPVVELPKEEASIEETTEEVPLTVNDLKAMIEAERTETQKLRDKLFGKVGELQQRIDNARAASTGLSPKARERLQVDFPELAEMLFDGEVEPEPEPEPEPTYEAPAYVPTPDTKVDDVEKKLERRILTLQHKDWEQVVVSPEFATWRATKLSPEEALELDESWDADFISGKIAEFKSFKEAQTKQDVKNKEKQDRLNAAITPRGTPRANNSNLGDDDEESAMMAAYGRRH